MDIKSYSHSFSTKGNTDIIDITGAIQKKVVESGFKTGVCTIFAIGSTCGITTVEYEPGLVKDLKLMFNRIVPQDEHYNHHERWGDDNGHSHVRASLLGPTISVPIIDGKLRLGTWQQIIYIDFDTSSRDREIVIQLIGK